MKRSIGFIFLVTMSVASWSQVSLFNNFGQFFYMSPGSYMLVSHDSLYNHTGTIQNGGTLRVDGDIRNDDTLTGAPTTPNGLYDIGGDWINNAKVLSYQDTVMLSGAAQQITGTQLTAFHNLILSGPSGSVKTQTINATADGVLALGNNELATQQNEMLVLNTNPAAISQSSASGFVSSTGLGKLSRSTNSAATYFYPVGTPSAGSPPYYYRPVGMIPVSADSNIYGVRLADGPTADGYDVNKKDDSLCAVNPLFYHRIYHTVGTDPSGIRMYYDPSTDGNWGDMAHWGSLWNYMGPPVAGTGFGFTTIEIPSWSDFSPQPFALASHKISVQVAGTNDTIDLGGSVQLTATGSSDVSFSWSPATGLSCQQCASTDAAPVSTQQYVLTAIDTHGCKAADTITVFVNQLHNVYIPNAFTPNGDGINDYFEIFGNKQAWTYVQVNIFDRWGEMVYESNDLDFKWDGTYKGQVEEPGIYVYDIVVTYADGYSLNKNKGSITLIR